VIAKKLADGVRKKDAIKIMNSKNSDHT